MSGSGRPVSQDASPNGLHAGPAEPHTSPGELHANPVPLEVDPAEQQPSTEARGVSPVPQDTSRATSPRSARQGVNVNAWVELLRLPALFTVPGDALAGAAAAGARPNPRTLVAIASSLCLYEAGMALNDWADRAEDAVDRPHRPLPSGRIRPAAALAAAGGLTAAGLALASTAGRRPLAVAGALAATVWSYDLLLKRTPAGPVAMAAARSLDLLLGGVAANGDIRRALPSALALGTHTLAVTTVSRHETQGGSPWAPLSGLATTAALAWSVTRDGTERDRQPGQDRRAGRHRQPGADWKPGRDRHPGGGNRQPGRAAATATNLVSLRGALAAVYAATAVRPLFHAALNPSPQLTQRAVGGGIRAMIPLQAALAARSGAPVTALLTAALAPAARRFGRKVSMT
ncbi:4-hydroxybenzoate polyprenyltransferase [Streptomyces umbrinus]|uniref:4-hydroxybenzoate polyprenyltransferase n=1 Tax=Streptomyces umbrinus TaxID=67370 RepID=A0ABU0SMQ1_9ACTN|nr:4-hydroxybenzoate polyprenyltransferase [Streptomyces umbrinus]